MKHPHLTCDTLSAQSADAWRRAIARARTWAREEMDATAALAGPAFAQAAQRAAAAALTREVVTDEHGATLRALTERCAAVSARRRASAERYRDQVHLSSDGDILRDAAGRRRAWICDQLYHRAAAAQRVSEQIDLVCREVEHALDCEAALGRIAGLRDGPT